MVSDPVLDRIHKTETVFEELYKQINEPITVNPSDYSLHDYKNLRQVIIEAGEKLEYDLTKLYLLYGEFNYNALDSLLSVVENSMNGLISISRINMACGMTLSARKVTIEKLNSIYTSSIQFFKHFELCYSRKEEKLSPSIVGAAMDSCRDLKKLPTSNKLAIQADLFSKMLLYKDVIQEFTELIQENSGEFSDPFKDALEDLDDGLNEVLDYKYSEEDIKKVKKGLQCINSLGKYFQQCVRIITKQPALLPTEILPTMDLFTSSCEQFSSDVDEFAVCFYDGCPKESTLNNINILKDQLEELNKTIRIFCDKNSDLYKALLDCSNSALEHFKQLETLLN